ncbi:MAG: glutaminyl-peptide cyclotransferase [Chloroflexota bacterium]
MQTRNFVLVATTLLIVLIAFILLNRGLLNDTISGTPAASKPETVVDISASAGSSISVTTVSTASVTSTLTIANDTLISDTNSGINAATDDTAQSDTSMSDASSTCPCPQGDSSAPDATPTADNPVDNSAVQMYTYRVVNSYPHDLNAFTQGLIWLDGVLYEGTGLRGRSSLRKVNLADGQVLQQINLPDQYFGEGITVWGEQIIQLTWQSRVGFVYELESFDQIDTFTYPTEGWGITHDGTRLIMSDGTPKLYFMDPDTLQQTSSVDVTLEGEPLQRLNELEYIDGLVYANVWQTNWIVMIDPQSGQVVGMINLEGLLDVAPEPGQRFDVLNGIAYDAAEERLFVTGKLWPRLYEIELILVPQ